jgi:threonine synthase
MDVSDPSNFVRILEMMGHDDQQLKAHISAVSINDDETRDAIRRLYNDTGYVLDPHGAVGWLALRQWLSKNPNQRGIFLETAHPVKFPDAVEAATGKPLELPLAISGLADRTRRKRNIDVSYDGLKEILVSGG